LVVPQRILIALDGSRLAEQALTVALWLARATAARLVVLRIAEGGPAASADEVVRHAPCPADPPRNRARSL
jgi:nucleotide-binding universal stress UspA family protein